MSHVLFVERRLRTDKLGLCYLAAALRDAGHTVALVQDEIDSADEYLAQHLTDFVMYSVMTGGHLWFLQRNRELKAKHRFQSVMGGPHFTFFPEQGLADECVDYVVQGPAEELVVDLVAGRLGRKILGNLPANVNTLPVPDRRPLYRYPEFGQAGMKRFIAGRDCRYNCGYCFNHLYHQLYRYQRECFFQITTPERMVAEISGVRQEWGLELVYFNDDDLAGNIPWLEEFCTLYKPEIGLPFCGSVRASSLTQKRLAMMAAAGCNFLNIALESANPSTQRLIGRTGISNEQVEAACRWCAELGIRVRLQNMIGLPVDDPLQDALDTLAYNHRLNPTDSWAAIFQPFPGTNLWHYCLGKGLIDLETESMNFYDETVLRIPKAEQINRLHKWWFFIVRHQWPLELVPPLLEAPLSATELARMQKLRWTEGARLIYGGKI